MQGDIAIIDKLTKARQYEYQLLNDIEVQYIPAVENMPDLLEEKKIFIKQILEKIMHDAGKNSFMLEEQIRSFMKDGND